MQKLAAQLIACLLVPCLAVDPAVAAGLLAPHLTDLFSHTGTDLPDFFQEQALSGAATQEITFLLKSEFRARAIRRISSSHISTRIVAGGMAFSSYVFGQSQSSNTSGVDNLGWWVLRVVGVLVAVAGIGALIEYIRDSIRRDRQARQWNERLVASRSETIPLMPQIFASTFKLGNKTYPIQSPSRPLREFLNDLQNQGIQVPANSVIIDETGDVVEPNDMVHGGAFRVHQRPANPNALSLPGGTVQEYVGNFATRQDLWAKIVELYRDGTPTYSVPPYEKGITHIALIHPETFESEPLGAQYGWENMGDDKRQDRWAANPIDFGFYTRLPVEADQIHDVIAHSNYGGPYELYVDHVRTNEDGGKVLRVAKIVPISRTTGGFSTGTMLRDASLPILGGLFGIAMVARYVGDIFGWESSAVKVITLAIFGSLLYAVNRSQTRPSNLLLESLKAA